MGVKPRHRGKLKFYPKNEKSTSKNLSNRLFLGNIEIILIDLVCITIEPITIEYRIESLEQIPKIERKIVEITPRNQGEHLQDSIRIKRREEEE